MRDRTNQSQLIAASSAALMAFHGILHEVIGPLLFPWAPAAFGAVIWHGMGIAVLVLGLMVWATVVELIRFPVLPVSIAIACLATGVILFFLAAHSQFHFFAFSLAVTAAATAFFYRRVEQATKRPQYERLP